MSETTSPDETDPLLRLAEFTRAETVGEVETTSETVNVTGIVNGLEMAVELIVIVPEYVPATSPEGSTATLRFAGVVPLLGLTASQCAPMGVTADALKTRAAPLLSMDTLCETGGEAPIWEVKVRVD
jgi:hypothetical protein